MSLDLSTLNKGQTRKLNALRKSLGNEIADCPSSGFLERKAA